MEGRNAMVTRINGFSGMDIDSLVKSMIATKRVPLDKVSQNKQIVQWQRDNYREVNNKLYDFRNNKLSLTGYKNSASFNTQVATVKDNAGKIVDSSNSAVKAEANANATGIPMKVSVQQIAAATTVKLDKMGSAYKTSMTLAEIQSYPAKPATPAEDVIADPFKLTLNGQETLEFPPETTLATVISKINNTVSLNVRASFNDVSGQLVLTSKTIGAKVTSYPLGATNEEKVKIDELNLKKDITIGNSDNSFLELFSKHDASAPTLAGRLSAPYDPVTGKGKLSGTDAHFIINEEPLTSSSNSATYNGVTFTFQGTTGNWIKDSDDKFSSNDDQPLNITTQVNSQKALETVKRFIEDYNTFIGEMNSRVTEDRFKDFMPLTDEQRKAMTESDVKAWEEKAKSGMLKNDPFIKTMLTSMRSAISEQLGVLSSMGITTGQYYENGKLHIDEAKFKKAVEANPQQVSDLFLGTAATTDTSLLSMISKPMEKAMDQIAERAGTSKFSGSLTATFASESVMGRQLKQYDSRISTLTSQLNASETRYYKQFAAMESAMNKYQSQLSQLTGASY